MFPEYYNPKLRLKSRLSLIVRVNVSDVSTTCAVVFQSRKKKAQTTSNVLSETDFQIYSSGSSLKLIYFDRTDLVYSYKGVVVSNFNRSYSISSNWSNVGDFFRG